MNSSAVQRLILLELPHLNVEMEEEENFEVVGSLGIGFNNYWLFVGVIP